MKWMKVLLESWRVWRMEKKIDKPPTDEERDEVDAWIQESIDQYLNIEPFEYDITKLKPGTIEEPPSTPAK